MAQEHTSIDNGLYPVDCSIVRDLIPSYVDRICSESSEKLVSSHIKKCEECKKYLEVLKYDELSAEKLNHGEIDFMKKIKRKSVGNYISYAILITAMAALYVLHDKMTGVFMRQWQGMLLIPAFLFGAYIMQKDYVRDYAADKAAVALDFLSAALLAYPVVVMYMALSWCGSGDFPTGLEAAALGPYVNTRIVAAAVLESLLFTGSVVSSQIRGKLNLGMQVMTMTGTCIGYTYSGMLRNLDHMEGFTQLAAGIVISYLSVGAVCGILLYLLYRRLRKKEK